MPAAASASNTRTKVESAKKRDQPETKRLLVIGGTLFIGRLLVSELARSGHDVYILHRKPTHPFGKRIHNLVADRNDAASLRQAVGSLRFDAVYDLAYDWERGTTALQVEASAQIFEGKVGRYVFMSSVAAYGDGLNHHEGDALAPDDHPNPYTRHKAMSERAPFRMYQRSGFPVVTLRPPFVYGPGNPFYREAYFWDRFRANHAVILPSEGHRLMQFIHVKDLVELAIKVVEQRNVIGHAFNTANARAVTQHELLLELARIACVKEPQLVAVQRELIHRAGGQVMGDSKLYFGQYFDLPAITQVITKAQRMLAFKPTDFSLGLKETYRAYLKERTFPQPDFSFEDALLSRFSQQARAVRTA
jgi:nucleoside-diphosphate-sugar epimerase